MSISHASLSGASLHEPKGIETASAGQVYVANGSNSGAWTATTSLSTPFTAAFFHAKQTSTQTFSAISNTLLLDTEIIDDLGITISSGLVPLASGTYYMKGTIPLIGRSYAQLAFYNNTDAANLILGHHVRFLNDVSIGSSGLTISCEGRFTIAATKTCSLRLLRPTNDIEMPASGGLTFVGAQLYLWKLA